MSSEFVWKTLPPKREEIIEPFEFSHSDIPIPDTGENDEHPYTFEKSKLIELSLTLESESNKVQEKIDKNGFAKHFVQFKNHLVSSEHSQKIRKGLHAVRSFLDKSVERRRERITSEKEKQQILENLQPGQNIAEFFEAQIDFNNQKIEKSSLKKAFQSFTKNAPARIIIGASLGALGGPVGMFGKLALSAVGGAFMGEGIAENKSESNSLASFSDVDGLRDEKTGEYDEVKLQEILSKLDKSELSKIVGGLSEVASTKGLKIAKNIAELSLDIEKNKNPRFIKLQKLYNSLPKVHQNLVKSLPILGGAAILATPFILPIAGLGVAGLAAGGALLSLLGSGIDRVSSGPKSIGKHYNHSRIIIRSIEELEKKMSNEKFDSLRGLLVENRDLSGQIPQEDIHEVTTRHSQERDDVIVDFNAAKKGVKDNLVKGTAIGALGMEALQHIGPLVEHKAVELGHTMSSVFGRFSSLFAHGGLVHNSSSLNNVISVNLPHSGLHLHSLDDGRILHWEGPTTTEHPVSSVNSLSHEVIYSVDPTLDRHDQNEAAHKLAQDWIHRGLFHSDGSLVQEGKENLSTQINAYIEAKAAIQNVTTT